MAKSETADLAQESDRGCVLVAAALLEEHLEELFRAVFDKNGTSKKLQDSLFDSNGPLATFSAKIKLAFSLGLVGRPLFEDLETVRRIRNDFAHSTAEADFSVGSLSADIAEMHHIKPLKNSMKRYSPALSPTKYKSDAEAALRVAGYLKYTKAIFSLGVKDMALQILTRTVSYTCAAQQAERGEPKN